LGFRLNAPASAIVRLEAGGETIAVSVTAADLDAEPVWRDGDDLVIFRAGEAIAVRQARAAQTADVAAGGNEVRAPMPGRVVAVSAKTGDKVEKGAPLLVMEAMKMEYALNAPAAGVVEGLTVSVGAQVEEGSVLAKVS
jgi:biotin carboxyl carrier protein